MKAQPSRVDFEAPSASQSAQELLDAAARMDAATNWLDLPSVVVATDLSDGCDQAIMAGHHWAKAQRTRLIIYHTVVARRVKTGEAPKAGPFSAADRRRLQEELSRHVQQLTNRRPRQFKVVVDSTLAHVGIIRAAEKHNAGVIILGPVNNRNATAARVIRRAPCSVMVARSARPPHRVLAATDLKYDALPAVNTGLRVAQQYRARMTVLHCVKQKTQIAMVGDRLNHRLSGMGHVESVVRSGAAAETILDTARGMEAPLIVVGTDSFELDRVREGVSEAVLNNADANVLVVPVRDPAEMH